jgi:hypothetical protein
MDFDFCLAERFVRNELSQLRNTNRGTRETRHPILDRCSGWVIVGLVLFAVLAWVF